MKTRLFLPIIMTALLAIPAPAQTAEQIKIARQTIPPLIEMDSLRVEGRKAWIAPVLWLQLDAKAKEQFTYMIAVYCSEKYPEVDVFDKQSGKKLASYGPFQGFKVE